MSLAWIFGAALAIVLFALVLRFGKGAARWMLTMLICGAAIILSAALLIQAQANRQVAVAARVASSGQTVATVGITLLALLLMLVVLIGGGIIAYLLLRLRRLEVPAQGRAHPAKGRWKSGPNARRQQERAGQASPAETGELLQTLVQLETLRFLQQLERPSMPSPTTRKSITTQNGDVYSDADDDFWEEGWF